MLFLFILLYKEDSTFQIKGLSKLKLKKDRAKENSLHVSQTEKNSFNKMEKEKSLFYNIILLSLKKQKSEQFLFISTIVERFNFPDERISKIKIKKRFRVGHTERA